MLVGLNCSKFNYLNSKNDCYFVKGSSDLIFERVWDNLSFSYKLDTQDFIITESNLIVLHHCAFKKKIPITSTLKFLILILTLSQ